MFGNAELLLAVCIDWCPGVIADDSGLQIEKAVFSLRKVRKS
jgi:hypothetical protein